MIELGRDDFLMAEPFFCNKKQYIPASAVIHGIFPGRVYIDDNRTPNIACVWATSRWIYVEGNMINDHSRAALLRFIQDIVIPDCIQRDEEWFEMYTNDSNLWEQLFLHNIDFLDVFKHYESVYTLDHDKFEQVRSKLGKRKDLQVDWVDYDVLPESYRKDPMISEHFRSLQNKGVELKKGGQLVSACYNNGLSYGNEYFIDVDTFRNEDRGKGYATIAAVRLIEQYLIENMNPLWETTHQNISSQQLAVKLGFDVNDDYPVYAFRLNTY